jgi:excisionase family DNA binding protein
VADDLKGAHVIDPDLYQAADELTTKQAAEVAKKDRRTIVAWIHRGELPALRNPGKRGHYRIKWQDLYQVLHQPAVPKA